MKQILIKLFIIICIKGTDNVNMSIFLKDYSFEPKISKFFSKLLRKYENFEIVFHTENKTEQYVGIVMDHFINNSTNLHGPLLTSYLVYNHDKLTAEELFSRPKVSKIVNFLFTKNWKLWKALAVPKKINSNDVVIFVALGNGTVLKTVDKNGIEFVKLAGKVLLLEIIPYHGVTLYETCYYCGKKSMKFQFIEKTHNSHLNTPKKRFMPVSFKDLNGHKFNIAFMSYFPYIICNRITNTLIGVKTQICDEVEGIESEMLKTISKKLNFTFELQVLSSDESFFNLVEFISSDKADIAIGGISMTVDRVPLVQFTNQYNSEEFTFLYLFSINLKEVFVKFIEPFNAIRVWALYIGAMILISVILFTAVQIRKRNKNHYIPYTDCLFIIFRGMLEQSNPHMSQIYRRRTSIAVTLGMWWFTCLILNTVYRSTVLSTVVNPASLEPDDMPQLLEAGYRVVANRQFADIVKELLMVPDPVYREALRKTEYGRDTCNVFDKMLHSQVAMLDEFSTIQFEIREACPRPNHEVIKWLRIGRRGLRSTGHAWATQRGAPYRDAIDFYLNLIISGGLFKKWTSDITLPYRKTMITRSREAINKGFRSMSTKRFFPLTIIYLVGILISVLAFISELIYYKIFHSNN